MSGPLIRYDWSGSQFPQTGLSPDALEKFAPQLNAARSEVLEIDEGLYAQGTVPPEKQPLDHGFVHLPKRLLAEYQADRSGSQLGRLLATASRWQQQVDRVVVLGIGGSYMGARALMEACVHPYHNELSRAERGGVPRLYFAGDNLDNDAVQGLLEVLPRTGTSVEDRWAIVVISKSGGTLETAAAFRVFRDALQDACGGDAKALAQRIVPVTGESGRLFDLATALGCQEMFPVPDGVGGRFSILSAVGLLPAAILGINVVRLLEGAVAMNQHFGEAPSGQNVVLQYVGVSHLLEQQRQARIRVLSLWSKALEAVGFWYDQLLAESLGKQQQGATPFTVVNTRDLHSRAQQHQEGTRDKLITNVILQDWRCDPVRIATSAWNQDQLNSLAGRSYPEMMQAAVESTNASYRDDGRPTANITLPGTDEFSLGQLFQMFMLATVVEGRVMGVNPYGQPGVEGYKRYLKASLGL